MSGAEPGIGLTIGRPELLRDGSDLAFRQMVSDLFTISARMQTVRDAVAERLGVSGPQSGILLAIWELQGGDGVGVKRIAGHLHVSGAFVTAETGRLARGGHYREAVESGGSAPGAAVPHRDGPGRVAGRAARTAADQRSVFRFVGQRRIRCVADTGRQVGRIVGDRCRCA